MTNQPAPIRFYNTMSRQIEDFLPIMAGQAGVYCCGPTVYHDAHLGNLKTNIFEDTLVRALRYAGYDVRHVMNITDVGHLVSDGDDGEDKMLVAARREKKKSEEVAEYYTKRFFDDFDALKLGRPDVVCKATEHITHMIELIKRLEAAGFTYLSGGNVYFDVSKFAAYGQLARLKLEQLQAGARVSVDNNKRNPQDFALWFTKSKFENQEMQWASPWGQGYPGWHIECSAMSMTYLGEQFDIHCGGADLIPVHHTNEIAQSEAATGKPWVKVWMHSEFMDMNNDKMSKSKGNIALLRDIVAQGYDPLAFKFLCLGSHYRSHLNFTMEALQNAANGLNKLKAATLNLKERAQHPADLLSEPAGKYLSEFKAAVFDDLNCPRAMASVWASLSDHELSAADKLALVYSFDQVFNLGVTDWQKQEVTIPSEIQTLMDERAAARKAKDWALSDTLRNKALELGWVIEDSAGAQKARVK